MKCSFLLELYLSIFRRKTRFTLLKEGLMCTVCVEIHLNPFSSQVTFLFRGL